MIIPRLWRSAKDASIPAVYGMIVAQARAPAFYRRYCIPDTVDGRFDMLVLHVALVMRRLDREHGVTRALGQGIFDRFCSDLDGNLREMGVGDLAVPREMRRMAAAFYGRQAAYAAALAATDDRELVNALARNIYGDATGGAPGAADLAAYVRALANWLDGLDGEALARARFAFPDPDRIAVKHA
jgi:cytochrome b pre-mRNA-processing protein 3